MSLGYNTRPGLLPQVSITLYLQYYLHLEVVIPIPTKKSSIKIRKCMITFIH